VNSIQLLEVLIMTQSTHRLSLARIEQAADIIDPVFLNSPQFVCEPLSEALGTHLALKIETLNPIRSFKGRGADLLVSQVNAYAHSDPYKIHNPTTHPLPIEIDYNIALLSSEFYVAADRCYYRSS
jgi:hypothetical protein